MPDAGARIAAIRPGIVFDRRFSRADVDPFDAVTWERRDARIRGDGGRIVFEQSDVEVPSSWSQLATDVVASKYFRGTSDGRGRESSVRRLVSRVVDTVTDWGREDGYFVTEADAETFRGELATLVLEQRASFNSPVWFNLGIEKDPQCSACFITSVDDTMESILDLAKTEGMLFKYGSGSGVNLSRLRGSMEGLSNGGTASGPVSFMRGFDAFAGAIKSGGKTRRAAKMVILDADHPDVMDFIASKAVEEAKARALVESGYDASFDAAGGAYDSVAFQNANHSVRVTDEFMRAVEEDREWSLRAVNDDRAIETLPARTVFDAMSEAAWTCGDPGIQFDTTINDWNTCSGSGRISASNPCSEFMFLDDSACNLASLNLLAFWDDETGFDVEGFRHACRVVLTAQEILVDRASYPTPEIGETSRRFRPLGIGFANLGGLLMVAGLPYDSDPGRSLAAAVAALMTGTAYEQSGEIAALLGPFEGFAENRTSALGVLEKHRRALEEVVPAEACAPILAAARRAWDRALSTAGEVGLRNSQVSVLAPTGTIAFMMDCDTTGVEPDLALVKHKRLVGGGTVSMVNRLVPRALDRLGYDEETRDRLVAWVDEHGGLEDAPGLEPGHLPVFDCALPSPGGSRAIPPRGHLRMMAALQPFLSGAISKTVNLPSDTTPEEIGEIYLDAWRLGVKAVAVYRDGCKGSQPVSTGSGAVEPAAEAPPEAARRRLPDEREALTHKFSIGDHEGYITVGLYEDGSPGEIFLVMAKEGSTISGLMDAFATAISIALQYGVPLEALVDKFSHTRFEPCGFTRNPSIPLAKSVTDYIFRWLASKFLSSEAQRAAGVIFRDEDGEIEGTGSGQSLGETPTAASQADAPPCRTCGAIMVRNGSCYRCLNCGSTSGCS